MGIDYEFYSLLDEIHARNNKSMSIKRYCQFVIFDSFSTVPGLAFEIFLSLDARKAIGIGANLFLYYVFLTLMEPRSTATDLV